MKHIAFIHYPKALLSSISFPQDILHAAAAAYQGANPSAMPSKFDTLHYPLDSKIKDISNHLNYAPTQTINNQQCYDLIILPAIWRNPKPVVTNSSLLIAWLKLQHQQGAHICAVGTASCFLAEAQLLDHQAATTHWFYFEKFAKDYPLVKLQRQHLITQANRLFCVGSINAIADLSIHISELFYGKKIAKKIESHFSPEIRRPIEQQIYKDNVFENSADELVSQAQYWIRENYMHNISMQHLADHLQISTRNLLRRFKKSTGISPTNYLRQHRLSIAKSLLRDSNLSIIEIASQTAYSDSSHFIRLFKQDMQTTPLNYRKRIRNKLFN